MTTTTDKLLPMHPGEVLREEFLTPLGLSAYAVAKAIGVTPQHVAALARGDRNISADVAVLLGRYFFGDAEAGARFWMNLQAQHDLEVALAERRRAVEAIDPHPRAAESLAEGRGAAAK